MIDTSGMKIRLKSLRATGWRVIASLDENVLMVGAYRDNSNEAGEKRRLEIRSTDPEVLEAMLWSMADDIRSHVPIDVGRQVLRLTMKMEEELGL